MHDLLADKSYVWRGHDAYVELSPGGVPAHVFRACILAKRRRNRHLRVMSYEILAPAFKVSLRAMAHLRRWFAGKGSERLSGFTWPICCRCRSMARIDAAAR